jgi:hypothetical protein
VPEVTAGSFTRQLSAPGYVLDLRPLSGPCGSGPCEPGPPLPDESAGGQLAGLAGAGYQPAEPCVLLLSRSRDAELDAVGRLLGKLGITVAQLDADRLAGVDLLIDPGRRVVRLDGRWLMPTVAWNRHFSPRAIVGTGPPALDLFRRDSWDAVAGALAALPRVSMGPPRIGLLEQQAAARRQQIAVPRTLVTTDPGRAREFLGAGRVVVKAADQHFVEASPGRLSGIFPVIATRPDPRPPLRPGIPVIVQEYVEHEAELRVYCVDGEVIGYDIRKEAPADPWLAPDRVVVSRARLPGGVADAARCLTAALGLHFGALDFLMSADRPVFLEVNPDGDWRWAEQESSARPVTLAVARLLLRLHRDACGEPPSANRGPAAAFSLLRFLAPG